MKIFIDFPAKKTIVAILFCALGSSVTLAQSGASSINSTAWSADSWYFSPSAAVLWPDSSFGVDGKGHGMGLMIGKPISREWDIQFGTKYAHQSANDLNYQQNTLGVDALFLFNRDKFRPFLLIGVGYQRDRVSAVGPGTAGQVSGYAPYVEVGLGAQLELDRHWALQLDFRREQGFLQNDDFATSRNRNNYLSLGVNYTFD